MRLVTSIVAGTLSGSSGNVTAATWKGRQYVRQRVTPANPNTNDQQAQRKAWTRVVECFQGIAVIVKTFLDKVGSDQALSGYNVMMSASVKDERDTFGHDIIPANRYLDPVAGLAVATGLAAGGLTVTWTAWGAGATEVPYILYRKETAVADIYETPWTVYNVGAVEMDAGTIEMTGLTAAKKYVVCLCPKSADSLSFGGGDHKIATSHA